MQNYQPFGKATLLTATGTVCLTSANAALIGVMFAGSGTGSLQIFCGTTSTGAAAVITPLLRGYATVTGNTANNALYFPLPAYCSGGITAVAGDALDVKLMIFWNPT